MAEQRSKPYPAIPVADAVVKLKELHKKLGDSRSYHKDNFATGLGYKDAKNGAFLRTVAALTQYGFAKKDGNDYKLTDLSRKILIPTTDTAEDEAVKEAVLTPNVFKQLYDRYDGQELPMLLPNILVTDFGILDGAKNKVATIFRQSMEYANLLSGNTLGDAATNNNQLTASPTEESDSLTSEFSENNNPPLQGDINKFEIVLREGAKAGIYAPYGLTEAEKEKLKGLIDLM